MNHERMALKELLERIERADSYEISDILHAVRNRFKELFPKDDFVLVSMPKDDPQERPDFGTGC